MLAVNNVSKRYRGTVGLDDVTVTVRPGELTVVLGPSGAGKTTLLKVLSLLDRPDDGTWELDGGRCQFPADQIAMVVHPTIGVVFQNLALWPHLTLRQNILLPLQVRGGQVPSGYVEELFATFDMREFIGR